MHACTRLSSYMHQILWMQSLWLPTKYLFRVGSSSVANSWYFSLQQFGQSRVPLRRQHAGPGFAYVTNESIEISGWKIVRVMLKHVWPKDQPSLKARVVIAVGLLFGAKVEKKTKKKK